VAGDVQALTNHRKGARDAYLKACAATIQVQLWERSRAHRCRAEPHRLSAHFDRALELLPNQSSLWFNGVTEICSKADAKGVKALNCGRKLVLNNPCAAWSRC
jgi:hypothetical protein